MVGKSVEDKSEVKELNEITNDDLILDIGPKTILEIKNIIDKSQNCSVEWTRWIF